jgi:hypothetical protein
MTRPTSAASEVVVDRRRTGRRASSNRRQTSASEARPQSEHRSVEHRQAEHRPVEPRQVEHHPVEHRQSERRKVERRRQIDPTTCERDYTPDQVDFMKAMDLYKRRSGRQFPTWSEVLEVLEHLGYRKVAPPTEIYKRIE